MHVHCRNINHPAHLPYREECDFTLQHGWTEGKEENVV